jgi:excisionase family DNA binding protein
MDPLTPAYTTASSLPARKITRHELAAHCGLSLRTIDELTRNRVLPFLKIGKAVRYDLMEVEAALRERFHVQPKARKQHSKGTRAPSSAT